MAEEVTLTDDKRRSMCPPPDIVVDDVPLELNEAESRELQQQDVDTPVRHLRIDWPSSSIKGVYAIGPSVPHAHPPLYDMPAAEDVENNAASAVFRSKSSPINATVIVLHGQGQCTPYTPNSGAGANGAGSTEAQPSVADPMQLLSAMRKNTVYVSAKTRTNSACVHVPSYVGRKPLHIKVQSHSGNAMVILPHSFNGLISYSVDNGTFGMSRGAASHAQHLDAKQSKRKGTIRMVVDPDLPAWMTGNGRRGDLCEISTRTGRLFVCMSGEKKPSGSKACIIC